MRRSLSVLLAALSLAWIAYTLYAVGSAGTSIVRGDVDTIRVMSVLNDETRLEAVGLSYTGTPGAVLAFGEIAVVVICVGFAVFARHGWRMLGLLGLVAWTGLWAGNAVWLQMNGFDRGRDVAIMLAGGAVTLAWAGLVMTAPRRADRPD